MGAIVSKGKKVQQAQTKEKEKEEKDDEECIQVVCKHGEESRAYNIKLNLHKNVREVWEKLEKEVVKDKIYELSASSNIKIQDLLPLAQKIKVVEGECTFTKEELSINLNTTFGRFYNAYHKSLKVGNKKRLAVQVSEDGLRFGKDKGMLLTFARCSKNGEIQQENFPIWKVAAFKDSVPEQWKKESGVFISLSNIEACWPVFHAGFAPFAVQVKVGNTNALTGSKWEESLSTSPQDYVVCPPQNFLPHLKTDKSATPLKRWCLQDVDHSTLQFNIIPMKRTDVCFCKNGALKTSLEGDWQLSDSPLKVGLAVGDEIYMYSMNHTRPACLADFGIAANSQIIARAIPPSEIKIFVQVSVPAQNMSKFFPFLVDPGIAVAELKYNLATKNPQLSDLYYKSLVYFRGKMLSADQCLKHHGVKEGDALNIIAGATFEGLCEDDSMVKWDINRAARVVVRLVSNDTFKVLTRKSLPPPSPSHSSKQKSNVTPPRKEMSNLQMDKIEQKSNKTDKLEKIESLERPKRRPSRLGRESEEGRKEEENEGGEEDSVEEERRKGKAEQNIKADLEKSENVAKVGVNEHNGHDETESESEEKERGKEEDLEVINANQDILPLAPSRQQSKEVKYDEEDDKQEGESEEDENEENENESHARIQKFVREDSSEDEDDDGEEEEEEDEDEGDDVSYLPVKSYAEVMEEI